MKPADPGLKPSSPGADNRSCRMSTAPATPTRIMIGGSPPPSGPGRIAPLRGSSPTPAPASPLPTTPALPLPLASLACGVVALDASGNVLGTNTAYRVLAAGIDDAPQGKAWKPFFSGSIDETDARARLAAVRTGRTWRGQLTPADASGHRRQWSVVLSPPAEPGGPLLGTIHDETARNEVEARRSRETRLESLSILAGGVAHDLNNVLFVISGNLELAEFHSAHSPEVKSAVDRALDAVDRARDFSRRMLTFAKGGDPQRIATASGPLVRSAIGQCPESDRLTLHLDVDAPVPPVHTDPAQFAWVVGAIVRNAYESAPRTVSLTVRIAEEIVGAGDPQGLAPGRYVVTSFTDDGDGIDADRLPRVLDPYFTTKRNNAGLGLTTAYAILRRQGGGLVLTSAVGRGTTVRVWLPAASEGPDSGSVVHRVLVLSADPAIADLAQTMVASLGHGATVAAPEGGLASWKQARDLGTPFDLLLADLESAPAAPWIPTLQAIRKGDASIGIALLGQGQDADLIPGSQRLRKPLTLKALLPLLSAPVRTP